ncbi:MAG: hypothetical protein ACOVOG_12035, partial [Rubrivivax sp.]
MTAEPLDPGQNGFRYALQWPIYGTTQRTGPHRPDALLDEAHVAVVPGEDFGACARGHVRLSFACSDDAIVKGIGR